MLKNLTTPSKAVSLYYSSQDRAFPAECYWIQAVSSNHRFIIDTNVWSSLVLSSIEGSEKSLNMVNQGIQKFRNETKCYYIS